MRTITVQPGQAIQLGRQYENEITQVIFPHNIVSRFLDAVEDPGIFGIWIHRPGDPVGYPIGSPLVTYADGQVSWLITSAELAQAGTAQVQLRYIVDNIQVMSMVYKAVISDSVEIGDDVPEPMEPWADAIMQALADVHGVPAGGTSGQVLGKSSDDDYALEWISMFSGNPIVVSSYDGGNYLGNQTLNTICRVSGIAGILDTPTGVDLSTYTGWLWTYGANNKHQILWYPHNQQIYQRLYRLYSGSWGWSSWVSIAGGGGSSISPYTSNPAALGTASPGSSDNYSRGDHVHAMPTAADVGAIAAPVSPVSGQFLSWNGSAWVAADLPVYNGGVI